jgi:electron transport complex protein RnfE
MDKVKERLFNGIIRENPTLVMMLGMCPTLAVTTSATNAIGMGLTSTAVLILSNTFISMLRNIIPDKVRVPAYIVIVASLVTIVQFLLLAYLPELNKSLGIYIPLIVVNCIILGRAEAYASKNPVLLSFFDGLGMGLGFTFGLFLLGVLREIVGSGEFFGIKIFDEPIRIIGLAPGAFFVLAILVTIQNKIKLSKNAKPKKECSTGCAGCTMDCLEQK